MAEESSPMAVKEASTHLDVIKRAESLLATLIDDPFLADLAGDYSLENVKSQLALLQGKAITVYINKADGGVVSAIVMQGATVRDLMQAFQRKVEKQCDKEGRTRHLSWRYVWRNYWLVCGQTLLEDPKAKLASYGVRNHASLHFTKKLKRKL